MNLTAQYFSFSLGPCRAALRAETRGARPLVSQGSFSRTLVLLFLSFDLSWSIMELIPKPIQSRACSI